ncbi:MAG: hypothetical protein LBH77_04985 [Tannerella sp.]|jgi:hypothetical protein|nr:hypothetical protein [Tannerella sp.]
MILTNYFLKKEIRKLTDKAFERPHQYRSFKEIKNILFICDTKDWNVVRTCIEKLRSMNKTINTAIYSPTEKDVPTWYSNYLLLRADKDVNVWGFPEKYIRNQFYSLPADLIIDFSDENSLPMRYMLLQHPSTFKSGIKRCENPVYDLSIIPPEKNDDLRYLFEQLLNYLQSITSK